MTRTTDIQAAEQTYRQALADYTSLLVEMGRDKEAADLNAEPVAARFIRALAAGDLAGAAQLLEPDVEFVPLTPADRGPASDTQQVLTVDVTAGGRIGRFRLV